MDLLAQSAIASLQTDKGDEDRERSSLLCRQKSNRDSAARKRAKDKEYDNNLSEQASSAAFPNESVQCVWISDHCSKKIQEPHTMHLKQPLLVHEALGIVPNPTLHSVNAAAEVEQWLRCCRSPI